MKTAFSLSKWLKKLTLTTFLSHFVLTGSLLFFFILLWLNTEDLNTLITPKSKSIRVNCDIQKPPHQCLIHTADGPIEIRANSEIISLIPFDIQLNAKDLQLSSAKIRFEGLYDYMGINQFRFSNSAEQQWISHGSIPICTTKSKSWKVIISLYQGANYSSYWFRMETE